METKLVLVFRDGPREDLGTGFKTWELSASLSTKGKAWARMAVTAHRNLLQGCDSYFTSPLVGAQQTLYEMMLALGTGMQGLERAKVLSELWTKSPARYHSDDPDEKFCDWVARNQEFVPVEAAAFFDGAIVGTILPAMMGKIALCVTHRRMIDLLAVHARVQLGVRLELAKVRELGECEGIALIFQREGYSADWKFTKMEELRMPAMMA